MRVIVCGAREPKIDHSFVCSKLDYITKYNPISILICGMARGIDTMAYRWALAHKIPIKPFAADWNKYGNSAGPVRNRQMLTDGQAELTIAFKTNAGPGTRDMIRQTKLHGVRLIIAEEFQPELMF